MGETSQCSVDIQQPAQVWLTNERYCFRFHCIGVLAQGMYPAWHQGMQLCIHRAVLQRHKCTYMCFVLHWQKHFSCSSSSTTTDSFARDTSRLDLLTFLSQLQLLTCCFCLACGRLFHSLTQLFSGKISLSIKVNDHSFRLLLFHRKHCQQNKGKPRHLESAGRNLDSQSTPFLRFLCCH